MYYFVNPGWYMKWLGTFDSQWPAYHLDLRISPSPFCDTPPGERGYGNGDQTHRQTDDIACLPGRMDKRWSSGTQECLLLSFRVSVTFLRSNRGVCFARIWIGICCVNKCSWTRTHHHFLHLSSPTVHHLWSCFAFSKYHGFVKFCSIFGKHSVWIFPLFASISSTRISV